MERVNNYSFFLFLSLIIALGLVSFASLVAAEFKKSKKKDLRLDGDLCYVPGSSAFELGMVALICLCIAQVMGNLFIFRQFFLRNSKSCCKFENFICSGILLLLSWISFGVAVVVICAATSMSRSQHFGRGWLDGECYIVKNGVYMGSAILIFLTLSFLLASAREQSKKVHA